jgi:hypothetical protein
METEKRPKKLQQLQWKEESKQEDHVKDEEARLKKI